MKFTRPHLPLFCPPVFLMAAVLTAFGSLSAADAQASPPAAAANSPGFVFTPPKQGEVLAPAMRDKLLAQVKNFLDRTNPEQLAHLKDAANPFYPNLPPAPAPTATTSGSSTPASVPTPAQLSPDDELQQVADQLKPSGALIGGQSRLIILANGETLAVGQSIQVTFPGDNAPTAVLLQDVSADNFTLKLGNTSKAFPFVAKGTAPPSNSSTTAPQPKSRLSAPTS